jgi:integrase
MAVSTRQVKNKRDVNGVPTGRAGTVCDVDIKYKISEGYNRYVKKGFLTKKEAQKHDAEMKAKLSSPSYSPVQPTLGKAILKEHLPDWLEKYGSVNLRPS